MSASGSVFRFLSILLEELNQDLQRFVSAARWNGPKNLAAVCMTFLDRMTTISREGFP
jgi:hypothetical protein